MIVGVDVHRRTHCAALIDERGVVSGTLSFPNTAAGVGKLRTWLAARDAAGAVVGIENGAGYRQLLCSSLAAAGHEVLNVPAWRTKRDRGRHGPGKTSCLHCIVAEIARLDGVVHDLDKQLAELVAQNGNPLEDACGAGLQVTATLMAQSGDVRRFRDRAAYARYGGAAPIPCGSGATGGRHRLHRGGNRQVNAALHRIAIVQAQWDPAAQAYLERKLAEGKTPREARRALKRHLANLVYRRLRRWAEDTLPSTSS